jgi:7,8-dihydro-6-hydroxymethylpterin-pyrophosphokinase
LVIQTKNNQQIVLLIIIIIITGNSIFSQQKLNMAVQNQETSYNPPKISRRFKTIEKQINRISHPHQRERKNTANI